MLIEGLRPTVVVADRPCRGLDIATGAGIEAVLLDRGPFGGFTSGFDRAGYSRALADELQRRGVTLIAMAGFGTILTEDLHRVFPGHVLNTHPSLLPDFKGWHAVAQALEAGVPETGCTVHVATAAVDEGPILAQRRVAIQADDTQESLHERIKTAERTLYPSVLMAVLAACDDGLEPATVGRLEGEW